MLRRPQGPRDPLADRARRSYLATTPDAALTRAAVPLLAFSWGFRIEAGSVTLEPPAHLDIARWTEHLAVLEDAHPGWNFRS